MAEEVLGILFGVEGGGEINGESGRRIVAELSAIVKSINDGNSSVPKIELLIDTKKATEQIGKVKKQLKELANMAKISMSAIDTSKKSNGSSGGNGSTKEVSENYTKLTTSVKEYYKALAEVQKLEMKNGGVQNGGGTWTTTDAQYKSRIALINQIQGELQGLGVTVSSTGDLELESAQKLNISEEEYKTLLEQVNSAATKNGITHEKSAAQIQAAWDKNAAKVHEYILRIQEVASKNPEVREMLSNLDKLAASGNPENLDELTIGLTEAQQKIRETKADIETWGQRFSNTFGTRVRSVLAGLLIGKVTQYLREIYRNVLDINSAMTQLKIVTGATDAQMTKFFDNATASAKKLGASITDILKSIETFSRLGYGLEDATTLAEYSQIMANVAGVTTDEATKGLTSIIKGYGLNVDESERVADVLVEVGQKYAVSASELMEAYAKAGAALSASNTSFEKSAGLIAAGNAAMQDASTVGEFVPSITAM